MKLAILGIALLLLDFSLYWGHRRLERERAELESRRDELSLRSQSHHESGEQALRIETLLRGGFRAIGRVDRELDIAELRDLLLAAERGLDLDRFSLDFRPAQDAPKGREGGHISANLGGSFEAVHDYLARVENLRLPLATKMLSLGAEDSGRILLAIEWEGFWSGADPSLGDLSASQIAQLETWLEREPAPLPGRDFFSARERLPGPSAAARLPSELAAREELEAGAEEALPAPPAVPKLTGFVIARPELETDIHRRVLAALRFEGELRLLGVGDAIGVFRVEEIEARDSVVLVNEESGERLKLFLE